MSAGMPAPVAIMAAMWIGICHLIYIIFLQQSTREGGKGEIRCQRERSLTLTPYFANISG
jgi:hypothetical protein